MKGEFQKRINSMRPKGGDFNYIQINDLIDRILLNVDEARKEIFQYVPTHPKLVEILKAIAKEDEANSYAKLCEILYRWFGSEGGE